MTVLGQLLSVEGRGVVRVEDRFEVAIDAVWAALTDPDQLAGWFGTVDGELHPGGEFHVRIALAGDRVGRIDICEPPNRIVVTMRDPDPAPGQAEQTVIEAELTADGEQTTLTWRESGMPVALLSAYGAGIQIHVEHLSDYLSGREPRDAGPRWEELLPAYAALTP